MKEFDWRKVEYPCLGISKEGKKVCFSEYGVGHLIEDTNDYNKGYYGKNWAMECFSLYTKPKEQIKLWYWEYINEHTNSWCISWYRASEDQAQKLGLGTYRKIEALGFIYEDK